MDGLVHPSWRIGDITGDLCLYGVQLVVFQTWRERQKSLSLSQLREGITPLMEKMTDSYDECLGTSAKPRNHADADGRLVLSWLSFSYST